MASNQVAFTTTAPGDFTLAHGLGVTPGSVIFEFTSGGSVWFQTPTQYDDTNLYLVASDAGITGFAIVYSTASPSVITFGTSTIRLQDIVDDASTLGDVAPALSTGGFSMSPAMSIGNDVMQSLINGGPGGQPYNWKWNRYNATPFTTISLQQDYMVPGVVNLGWIESAWAVNLNQTSVPKQKTFLEVHKDLLVSNDQQTYVGKICWIPNNMCNTGTWGQVPLGPTAGYPSGQTTVAGPGNTGQQNPGPGVIYTNPIGTLLTPQNASTCIKDPNGNLWTLTTFGVCGTTQPTWPSSVDYPTVRNPNIIATTVTDGTCVWTAVNPNGQGFRLLPIPPQSGVVWQIQVVGQMKAPRFTNLQQYINPIPDDFEWAFKQGFFAECFRRNPDPKVRAKYQQEKQWWLESLDKAVRQEDRQMDDFGFYPGTMIMDTGWGVQPINPAQPFGPWSGW